MILKVISNAELDGSFSPAGGSTMDDSSRAGSSTGSAAGR